jgi:uncharacterized protein
MREPPFSELLAAIRSQYRLDWHGIHGVAHWARVWEIGRRLGTATGANADVVALFAIFHDACRHNDHQDPEHGLRGAELARSFRGSLIQLPDSEFELLGTACSHHTKGLLDADVTVQVCWDADRLDLGRVGIPPDTTRLCTQAARDPLLKGWAESLWLDGAAGIPREWRV